jgi:hypothetical protein
MLLSGMMTAWNVFPYSFSRVVVVPAWEVTKP